MRSWRDVEKIKQNLEEKQADGRLPVNEVRRVLGAPCVRKCDRIVWRSVRSHPQQRYENHSEVRDSESMSMPNVEEGSSKASD